MLALDDVAGATQKKDKLTKLIGYDSLPFLQAKKLLKDPKILFFRKY